MSNTRIYTLSSGPHISDYLAAVAKKWKIFGSMFVFKRASIACRQKMTRVNLL